MISPAEQGYLHALGRGLRGRGHVVEIGPWLGGSTVCLAAGLLEGPAADGPWRVHAFDAFVWYPFMAERAALPLAPGESFLAHFRRHVERFGDRVVAHEASLPDERVAGDPVAESIRGGPSRPPASWAGEPVELLFVDGAKSWTAMRHVLATFGPSLVDGARLVFQDYRFWGAWWVPAMLEAIADCVRLERVVPANTVAFVLERPLDEDALNAVPTWEALETEQAARWIEAAVARLRRFGDTEGARVVALSHARLRVHRDQPGAAVDAFRDAERRWPLVADAAPLEACRRWLAAATGRTLAPGVRGRIRRLASRARRVRARIAGRA